MPPKTKGSFGQGKRVLIPYSEKGKNDSMKEGGSPVIMVVVRRIPREDRQYVTIMDLNDAVNLFAYASNNPIRLADPSGLTPQCAAGAIYGGLASAIGSVLGSIATQDNRKQLACKACFNAAGGALAGCIGFSVASACVSSVVANVMATAISELCDLWSKPCYQFNPKQFLCGLAGALLNGLYSCLGAAFNAATKQQVQATFQSIAEEMGEIWADAFWDIGLPGVTGSTFAGATGGVCGALFGK